MSLFSSMVDGFQQLRADTGGMGYGPLDDFWYKPAGGGPSAGMRITPENVKRIASVYACVDRIAQSLTIMPAKIFTETSAGKQEVPTHPLASVLAKHPNQQQTACDFFQQMQWWKELRGNAYAEIVPGPRGAVDQLLPMHPDRIQVTKLNTGRLQYKYSDPLTNTTRTLMQEEVFHLRNHSDNGMTGESTIALGSEVFGVALGGQDYSARFFQNDAKPSGVIEGTNFRDKGDEETFRESWQKSQAGNNRHKTAILPAGVTYKAISITPQDAQLLDARKFSRIEICSMFGVPPHLIGETEKTATYASVEQFNIMFAVQCLLPRVICWEQTIARDLILDDQYFCKFSMAALLRGDQAARFAAYQIAVGNGWMNQDEIRALEDLNPIADGSGKTYWRPLNWAPLAQIENPQPSAPGGDDEEDDPAGDAEVTGEDPDDAGDSNAHVGRLKLLAQSAVDRCVRKELAGLKKLLQGHATAETRAAFYDSHTDFIAEVLNIPKHRAKLYSDSRLPVCTYAEVDPGAIQFLTNLAIGVN